MRTTIFHTVLMICLLMFQRVESFAQINGKEQTAQTKKDSLQGIPHIASTNPRVVTINDVAWLISGICKTLRKELYKEAPAQSRQDTQNGVGRKQSPFLTVHGNVQYDFLYRSYVDTPFAQKDLQQHTVQASLRIVVKDRYPLKVNITTRGSNSPYFRNFFDVGLSLDQFAFTKDAKKRLAEKVTAQRFEAPALKLLRQTFDQKKERYDELKLRLADPDVLQQIIEERESAYYRKKYGDSLLAIKAPDPGFDPKELNAKITRKNSRPSADSISIEKYWGGERFSDLLNRKNQELDSLRKDLSALQQKMDSVTRSINKDVASIKERIYKAKSRGELRRIEVENGIAPNKQAKAEHFLSNLRTIGLGRSMVNYTELTAQGISLTGLNAEYNDGHIYAAVTAGKVDYGFRDLVGRHNREGGQSLLMGRIGIGDKDRRALIFSAFTGRKFNYGSSFSDTVSSTVNIAGYSIEGIWAKDDYNGLSAEIAKSTKPLSGGLREHHAFNNLVNFSDRSNLGVNIKGQARIRETDTRISGLFRKTGENFQSFSLFTYNTDQTAWHLKLDQPLLNNKVDITAMLRRNDFTNPFTDKTFKTSTVFTSLQTTIRIPHLPVLSVGYFPGSQLYMIDKEHIRENAYYIFNGSLIYAYGAGQTRMTSSVIYNRYSSKGTDSGFIAYKGTNYLASQAIMWRKVQLQGVYAFTDQEQLQFYTLEFNADYSPFSFFKVGGGGKYNKLNTGKQYWGSRAQVGMEVKKIGSLQLIYEKAYLPTIYQDLFPIEMGRVTWFKYF